VRIKALNRQNNWSDFGKGFIVKVCKNTEYSQAFKYFIIRKYAQKFPNFHIYNLFKDSKIQNIRKADMNTIKERLGILIAALFHKNMEPQMTDMRCHNCNYCLIIL
jgi:hypothetical protein